MLMRCRCICDSSLIQHCACSADKMRRGLSLVDEDRWPWLHVLASLIASHRSEGKRLVMGCSALKEAYRDILRGQHPDSMLFVSPFAPCYIPNCRHSQYEHTAMAQCSGELCQQKPSTGRAPHKGLLSLKRFTEASSEASTIRVCSL